MQITRYYLLYLQVYITKMPFQFLQPEYSRSTWRHYGYWRHNFLSHQAISIELVIQDKGALCL